MKILYLCPWPNPFKGGYDKTAHPNGAGFGYEELKEMGADIHWHNHKRNSLLYRFFRKIPQVNQIFCQLSCVNKANSFDVIYCGFDMHILPLAVLRAMHIIRKPIFVVSHFSYNSTYTDRFFKKIYIKFERVLVYHFIDRISFASKVLLDLACKDYPVPQHHKCVANWGANLSFYNVDVYKSTGVKPKNEIFIASGGKNRDYATLIKSFNIATLSKIKIYAKYKGNEMTLPPNVEFVEDSAFRKMGENRFKLLRDEYFNSIAVCIPIDYVNDVPNGATVLVEALAMGKPILITRMNTNLIDVEKEGCGFMVNRKDPQDWAEKLTFLQNNPHVVKKMSENALHLAKTRFNSKLFAETIYSQMKELK